MKPPAALGEANGQPRPHAELQERDLVWAHLMGVLLDSTYDSGEKKGAGILIIKPRQRQMSGTLKIEGSGLMLPLVADGLLNLLDAYDALLGTGIAPWEKDPYASGEAPPKRKR